MNHHEHFCLTKKSTEKAKHCKEEEKENVIALIEPSRRPQDY